MTPEQEKIAAAVPCRAGPVPDDVVGVTLMHPHATGGEHPPHPPPTGGGDGAAGEGDLVLGHGVTSSTSGSGISPRAIASRRAVPSWYTSS